MLRCRIGDRFVVVVTLDQDREQAGDRARSAPSRPRPLQQPRQFGEHRRRVALGGRRLAGGKADLALRLGETGNRVDQAEHVLALVAEILRQRQRQIGRLPAHQRRLVRGRHHDDGAPQALNPKIVLDEFLHLAPTLADQADR
jgi:hypothetical protein